MSEVRRLVTGHDDCGRSTFLSVGLPPQFHDKQNGLAQFTEIWRTPCSPAPITSVEDEEPNNRLPLRIPPDPGGTIFRILDLYPGHVEALRAREDGRHPGMHRTATIDYAIILEGEIWAIMDIGEELMRAGDVLIQRGTDHAWENRSNERARVAFILVDGSYDAELSERFGTGDLMHGTLLQRSEKED